MISFQILPFLKIFVTDFSGTMKARKLEVCINMVNDWMYRVYMKRGQGSITLGVISLSRFSKTLKCTLLSNFYVCCPTSMELIPHLGALKKWYMHRQWVDVSRIQESGPRAHNSWIKIP